MKTLFLTGGATGIGREVANLFYKNNYNVAFIDTNKEEAQECVKEWDKERYLLFIGSVTERETLNISVKETIEKFGKIDTLILNAGIHRSNTVLSIEDEELDLMINVNIKGYINTLKAAMPSMIEAGGGSIVVNASDQAFIGKGVSFGYGLTKGAIGQMIKNIALDYGSKGITISGVCAGTIETPLAMGAMQRWADREFNGDLNIALKEEATQYAVGRLGKPEEVAQMFFFLANAPFVTGSLHLIDGGLTAR